MIKIDINFIKCLLKFILWALFISSGLTIWQYKESIAYSLPTYLYNLNLSIDDFDKLEIESNSNEIKEIFKLNLQELDELIRNEMKNPKLKPIVFYCALTRYYKLDWRLR